ncbi:MAG: nucleotidyltransferase domain-containing protein [Candidatus Thorarchaeota archaeon]
MMDLHRKFDTALQDTVDEWKKRDEVKGIFTYGSFVRGTATANSDLDILILWDGSEAPARLMAEHMGVTVDMDFITPSDLNNVFSGEDKNSIRIAGIISRMKGAKVHFDTDGMLKKWLEQASKYVWPEELILGVKTGALEHLKNAESLLDQDKIAGAIHQMRRGIYDLGRVAIMRNNIFSLIKPSEVLSEIRMLDPMMYPLFLWTFKLKGMDEDSLMETLRAIEKWLKIAVEKFETGDATDDVLIAHLTQAQRFYKGAETLTLNGEYELAVIQIRKAITMLGLAFLALQDAPLQKGEYITIKLHELEPEFYEQILLEHGAYDMPSKAVGRGIGEARFMAQRL